MRPQQTQTCCTCNTCTYKLTLLCEAVRLPPCRLERRRVGAVGHQTVQQHRCCKARVRRISCGLRARASEAALCIRQVNALHLCNAPARVRQAAGGSCRPRMCVVNDDGGSSSSCEGARCKGACAHVRMHAADGARRCRTCALRSGRLPGVASCPSQRLQTADLAAERTAGAHGRPAPGSPAGWTAGRAAAAPAQGTARSPRRRRPAASAASARGRRRPPGAGSQACVRAGRRAPRARRPRAIQTAAGGRRACSWVPVATGGDGDRQRVTRVRAFVRACEQCMHATHACS